MDEEIIENIDANSIMIAVNNANPELWEATDEATF